MATIPLRPRDKPPAIGQGKSYQTEIPSADDLHSWFNGNNNIGLITG
jgi:hypothetical protein